MFIADKLRRTNIAEYLLYMWQMEDTLRVYGCSLPAIRREYISRFDLTDEQREEEIDWFGSLIRMMRREGCEEHGHLSINKATLSLLEDLNKELLEDSGKSLYRDEYYKVLPYIVELRNKSGDKKPGEIETCFNLLYGVMLLRLQKKEISPETTNAAKEIGAFIGMLNEEYIKRKE